MLSLNTPADGLQALGAYTRKSRLNANNTMADLAQRSGVGIATLSRFERKGICSTDTMLRIFAALGVLDDFIKALSVSEPMSIADLRRISKTPHRQRARRER